MYNIDSMDNKRKNRHIHVLDEAAPLSTLVLNRISRIQKHCVGGQNGSMGRITCPRNLQMSHQVMQYGGEKERIFAEWYRTRQSDTKIFLLWNEDKESAVHHVIHTFPSMRPAW